MRPALKITESRAAQEDDRTIVVPSPSGFAGAPGRRVASRPDANIDDRTIILTDGLPGRATDTERPQPASPLLATKHPSPPNRAPHAETAAPRRAVRGSWSSRIFVHVVGLAVVASTLVGIAMSLWQARILNATGVARATAVVNWLAAAAALASDRSDIGPAAEAITHESGVVSALLLDLNGRVLSPPSRAGEIFLMLTALNLPPSAVYRLRTARGGGLVQAARPVVDQRGVRKAIAWVSLRPSVGADDAGVSVVLGPALLIVLGAAIFVASSIRRTTLRGLALLNEDIELAIGGQLEAVEDPLGAKPTRDLADTVNYFVAKARRGRPAAPASGQSMAPDQRSRVESRVLGLAGVASRPPTGPVRVEAHVIADGRFRITQASPECTQVIGVTPQQMIGEHLVDALPSKELAEAVLKCLGQLPPAGEDHCVVTLESGTPLAIVIARSGKDRPVTITFRSEGSAVPA